MPRSNCFLVSGRAVFAVKYPIRSNFLLMAKTVDPSQTTPRPATAADSAASSAAPAGLSQVPAPASYEAALAELEALVGQMEGGNLSLEASLSAYRRGATLVTFCQQQLEKVEQQVRVLDGDTLKSLNDPDAVGVAAAARSSDSDADKGDA